MRRLAAALLLLGCGACGGAQSSLPPSPPGGQLPVWAPASGGAPSSAGASAPTTEPGTPLSAASLMRDVRHLASDALRGRGSATDDEARAAEWLAARTAEIGLATVAGSHVHPFRLGTRTSRNVLAELVPPRRVDERIVVVGAHFDHDGMKNGRLYPGADDNASGVAAVLAIARTLAAAPDGVGRRVVFVFFGSEETGLHGAWALTRSGPLAMADVAVMVNVDMVGRPLQDQPTFRFAQRLVGIDAERSVGVAGLRDRPWLASIVHGAAAAEQHRAVTLDDLPESLRPAAERISYARGDHFPFEQAGVPAVIFSSGESVDYHQPTDTAATLHPELLATRARVVHRTVVALTHAAIPEATARPSE